MQLIINILDRRKISKSGSLLKGHLTYLSLGSNLGHRAENLDRARRSVIQRIGPQLSGSGIYETIPWGYESKHLFYNCCIGLKTALEPLPMLDEILSIEKEMGRQREPGGYRDRIIDIDILFYAHRVLDHPRLILPHPSVELRRFVLVPLDEIAPDMKHPVSGESVKSMLERCEDQSRVVRVGSWPSGKTEP
jgi:2-amino-4-hydroxy-6-hydroxymethyldihydropteridine diphosphokinase